METSREDFGITIRSAFLKKGAQQKFSLLALLALSIILLFLETIDARPLNYLRSIIKDTIYRGSTIVSLPSKGFVTISNSIKSHMNLYEENTELRKINSQLKDKAYDPSFIIFENKQLKKLLEDKIKNPSNMVSSRVILDKDSPYLNSFIINIGSNKNIKNGMAVLDGKNFVGRIVDVNFFSSRVLLVSDLNSKIPVIIEPSGNHAILSGGGTNITNLIYVPDNHNIQDGDKVYTSGKEGIFSTGIPIGEVKKENDLFKVNLFSDLSQITFINIDLERVEQIR